MNKNTIIGVLVVLLIVIGGYAVWMHIENGRAPSDFPVLPTTTTTTTIPPALAMQKYTDANFGFSFWYPSSMQISAPTSPSPFASLIQAGTVVKTLQLGSQTILQEVHSPDLTITDSTGKYGSVTYYFDTSTHTWMTKHADEASGQMVISVADTSHNTMGGLHIFPGAGGGMVYDVIIPLSGQNFVVISSNLTEGPSAASYLVNTILALDPAVATPVSQAQQTQTIAAEQNAYAN